MTQQFVFGLAGAEDLSIGGDTFTVTLPDGSVVTTYHEIGSHTFQDGLRNVLQNGCVGNGTTDDRPALNTLANTTLSAGGSIYFPPGVYRISSNITFPSNVELVFGAGSSLSADTGVTVTINGTFRAGLFQIFRGLGTFTINGPMPFVSPTLWGAVADGATDDSLSILAAIDSLPARGGTVLFTPGTYKITRTIEIGNGSAGNPSTKNGIRLCSTGVSSIINMSGPPNGGSTVLNLVGNSHNDAAIRVNGPCHGVGVSDFTITFDGNTSVTAVGILDNGGNSCHFENITVISPPRIGIIDTSVDSSGGIGNTWKNIQVFLSVVNSQAILITGDLVADRAFDSWENILVIPNDSSQTGIQLQVCDSIKITNFVMNPAGGTSIQYNYTLLADFPNGIVVWGMDPFDNFVVVTGTPPTNTNFMNRIYAYSQDNGSAIPIEENLEIVNGGTASRTLGKQVDVVAANNMALGSGNLNVVSGATQINAISIDGWTNGSIVTLFFSSNPLLKNNQSPTGLFRPIHLNGGADLATTANDMVALQLVSGEWWQVAPASVN